MSDDYIILTILAVLSIGGGLFLIRQAKDWRARKEKEGSCANL